MAHWLVKSDPDTYSAEDLAREKRTVWDGVKNATALNHIRAMQRGDDVFVYHSGKDKAIVALAQVVKGPYHDPQDDDEKLAVVDLKFVRWVAEPVTLKAIKADKRFADFALVRMSRLSVMPVPDNLWQPLMQMAGEA